MHNKRHRGTAGKSTSSTLAFAGNRPQGEIQMKELDTDSQDGDKGLLDRRGFVKTAGALGLGTVAATSMGSTRKARADSPRKGGSLRLAIGHGSTSDSLDPHTLENGMQVVSAFALVDTLTELDADNKLVPVVASEWDSSPDARIWTFKIRKGIEFSDGRPITAKDVAATINYHRGDVKSIVKQVAAPIKEIKVDDDHTISIELQDGNSDFPFNMSVESMGIYPAADDGSLDWKSGIGSGGYKLNVFDPGVRSEFVRNDNYWRAERAHVDEASVLTIHDSSARSNALVTGEVDVIDGVDPKVAGLMENKDGISVEATDGPLHYTFEMRSDLSPFDDNNVRMALKLAIDREHLVKSVLRGYGEPGNDTPIGPSYRYHASDIPQRTYDPDKAKFHLKQAGLSKLSVDLSAADAAFSGAVDSAVLIKEHAAAANIDVNVIREPNDGYWSNVWNKKGWCASYWAGYPTEDFMFGIGYISDAPYNATRFYNERFDKLYQEARTELDEGKRFELYREMQLILRDEGGLVVSAFAKNILARRDTVSHGKLSRQRGFDDRKIIERWWAV